MTRSVGQNGGWTDVSAVPCECCDDDPHMSAASPLPVVSSVQALAEGSIFSGPEVTREEFASWVQQVALRDAPVDGASLGDHVEALVLHLKDVLAGDAPGRSEWVPRPLDQ